MANYGASTDVRPTAWLGGWRTLFIGRAALVACNLFLWVFDYNFAAAVGLDSTTHAFTTHFRALFWGELISLGLFAGICTDG